MMAVSNPRSMRLQSEYTYTADEIVNNPCFSDNGMLCVFSPLGSDITLAITGLSFNVVLTGPRIVLDTDTCLELASQGAEFSFNATGGSIVAVAVDKCSSRSALVGQCALNKKLAALEEQFEPTASAAV